MSDYTRCSICGGEDFTTTDEVGVRCDFCGYVIEDYASARLFAEYKALGPVSYLSACKDYFEAELAVRLHTATRHACDTCGHDGTDACKHDTVPGEGLCEPPGPNGEPEVDKWIPKEVTS